MTNEVSLWDDGWTYVALVLFMLLFGVAFWRCARCVRSPMDSEFVSIQHH